MYPTKSYVSVILPLKIRGFLSYGVPQELAHSIRVGSWVTVRIKGHEKLGIVSAIEKKAPADIDKNKILDIESLLDRTPVGKKEMEFWNRIADYYMCTTGEVFKAVYNSQMQSDIIHMAKSSGKKVVRKKSVPTIYEPVQLSVAQTSAFTQVEEHFKSGRTVLLQGVTGSGKTEIYIHLAKKTLAEGKSVLYLVPEIAISKQLQNRLERVFGEQLKTYHSKQTTAGRREVAQSVRRNGAPVVVLGTRSAIFLPFDNLGLIIIDEEHDHSYKQTDPAPRYNGRDGALFLGSLFGANVVLGSATPSCESLYNVETGKFGIVKLEEKFHNNLEPAVKIIDTTRERRLGNMKGSLSMQLIKKIRKTVANGGQVMVFRSRRAYSPIVQCTECGAIPKCPNCNVSLSFHKYNYSLSCHYCGYCAPFTTRCPQCGEPSLTDKGAGTEKIEEELQEIFPDMKVARFDAETTTSKAQEEKILKEFASGETDILVGTQMITKGFDFERLALVAVISADSLFAVDDFRCDERANQLLTQLLGRAGRRETRGTMIIQTAQKERIALNSQADTESIMAERKMFGYPPFVRLVKITVTDSQEGRLWNACRKVKESIESCGIDNFSGPLTPAIDRIDKRMVREFWIKLSRERNTASVKKALSLQIGLIDKLFNGAVNITVDVDPL